MTLDFDTEPIQLTPSWSRPRTRRILTALNSEHSIDVTIKVTRRG